jgi:tetratricopeptide (TPR) repeat protein
LLRARIAEVRKTLLAARLRFDAGDREGAWDIALAAEKSAVEMKYCPLEAEALVTEANVIGEYFVSISVHQRTGLLKKAIAVGQRCGHDRIVAEAATQLVGADADPGADEDRREFARATIERIGGDARLEGWLANNVGISEYLQGRVESAILKFRTAISLKLARVSVDELDVALSESNVAEGLRSVHRLDEALSTVEHALPTMLRWSPTNPLLAAETLETKGDVLVELGRLDEAEDTYRMAVAIAMRSKRGDKNVIDFIRGGLGRVLLARSDGQAALPYLERALKTATFDQRAEFQFLVAQALGLRNSRARALAAEAETYWAAHADLAWRARDVAAWKQSSHRARRHQSRPS